MAGGGRFTWRVEISEVDGVPPGTRRQRDATWGEEAARAYLEQIDRPGRGWPGSTFAQAGVGVHDFQSRLPSALGGIA
jgi:hypothetical protein